jgi:hypothetical protein
MTKTARKVLDQLKVFILVALLTALVWMLAEAESLRVERLPAVLAFSENGRLVRVEPGQEFTGHIHIRMEGPTSRVDELAIRLRRVLHLEPGMDGVPLEPGRHTINLREALRYHPQVRDIRVTIVDVEPATVTVVIDNLVTRSLPVRVEVPPGQVLDAAPEAAPTLVDIRMPESAARRLTEGAQAVARPDPAAVAALPEGRRGTIPNVPVEVPEALLGIEGIRVLPPQVSISLTLRSRTATLTLATVPVHMRLPPEETTRYDIQIPQNSRLLTNVTVSGPSDIIEQIRENRLRPIAYITLTFEDLERAAAAGEPVQAEVTFSDLPSPLRFETATRTIPVEVQRRENNAGTPEG